ncbi:MAG: hypothetical protein EBS86_14230, partial [Crocinitomicaceae bacterium]|nr:hypothetical protein [Crocinitomicaceae bacterium]
MERTIDRYQKLHDVFGKENLSGRVDSPFDFITIAVKGFNSNAILHFNDYFNLSKNYTANLLSLSEPTL